MGKSILVERGTGVINVDWSFAELHDKIQVKFARSLQDDR